MQIFQRSSNPNSESKRRRKLGEIVAERIIGDIIHKGWPEGEVLGTEADFMDRYRVSRATFREAVRQLEWHGAAFMRRGARGGLEVKAPPRSALIFSIKAYFSLTRVGLDAQQSASEIISKAGSGTQHNDVRALFLEALDHRSMAAIVQEASDLGKMPKLSEQVALRIIHDIEDRSLEYATVLGSEAALQSQYDVSRSIMRQALRLLELHGIVRVKTGAHGGVIVHRVNPEYTVELADTYLNYARIPLDHLLDVHASLEIAAVQWAAPNMSPETIERLRRAYKRLDDASANHYLSAANRFHEILADATGNAAISLFIRILLHYSSNAFPIPSESGLKNLKCQHYELIDALSDKDTARAQSIMQDMFKKSRKWIATHLNSKNKNIF